MPDFSKQYLTFIPLEDGTFSHSTNAINYSTDSGSTWQTLQADSQSPTFHEGDKIMWKMTNPTINTYSGCGVFSSTCSFEMEGNIMSLYFGDNFSGQTSLAGKNNIFRGIFGNLSGLTSIENLVLPATTLADYCYRSTFQNCSNLTKGPKTLPATTLTTNCYYQMFLNCSKLTASPILPAPSLTNTCYQKMFQGCSSLNHIICLATSGIITNSSTTAWVSGVSSTGLFEYSKDYVSGWVRGVDGVPNNWTMSIYNPFYVDIDAISAPASGSAYTINLTSQNSWTASTNDSWITVSPSSGTGDTTLTITISENKGFGRSGTVELIDSDSNQITITVYQSKASVSLKSCSVARSGNVVNRMYREGQLILLNVAHKPYLDLSEDELNFDKEASSTMVIVDSNLTWTSSTSTPWITITTGSGTLNVAVSENTTGEDRGGTITITGRNMLGTVSTSITVNQTNVINYSNKYLTVVSREDDNTITFFVASSATQGKTLQYSTDGGSNWTSFTMGSSNQTKTISLNSGEAVMFKGDCDRMGTDASANNHSRIYGSKTIDVYGNIMSMLYGDDFIGKTSFKSTAHTYTFTKFLENAKIVDASNLILPATTLIDNCYRTMMWQNYQMTKAPVLSASTLVSYCYYHLFDDCTVLSSVTILATSGINSNNSTTYLLYAAASNGTFYKKRGASWPTGVNGIPSGWTVVEVD